MTMIQGFILGISLLLTVQALFTLYLMLYTWEDADKARNAHAPTIFARPQKSFTAMLPARGEEAIIYSTIQRIWNVNYPRHLLQILVICHDSDKATIAEAQRAIDAIGSPRVRVVTFSDPPINKPHGLNVGLSQSTGDVVTIFDAEDDISPDIFQVVNTIMVREDVGIVQGGVQLINFRDHWFSAHNCLEYFFWFKSRLHFHATVGMILLGGNTVFFQREQLRQAGGWDDRCLTEDADIGLRLSTAGQPIRVFFDARYSTREETPESTWGFIKQRTRWHQGFLQVMRKGAWRTLPRFRQRALALYSLSYPLFQAAMVLLVPLDFAVGIWAKVPVLIALISYLPFCAFLLQALVTIAGIFAFGREFQLKVRPLAPVVMALTYIPYQVLQSLSAIRAVWRESFGKNDWEKTTHVGAHREAVAVATRALPERVAVTGEHTFSHSALTLVGAANGSHAAKSVATAIAERELADAPSDDKTITIPFPTVVSEARRRLPRHLGERLAFVALLIVAGVAHAVNMFQYPYYFDDEGTYMAQSWSVLAIHKLSPYTYWYDHAPVGWLLIALWALLTGGLHAFGLALYSGRVLMLVLQLASTASVYGIARQITKNPFAAFIAALAFGLSPYGLYFHRRILIDNIATFWLLLSILSLVIGERLRLRQVWLSALCFALSFLTKETTIVVLPALVGIMLYRAERYNRMFSWLTWGLVVGTPLAFYILFAALNGELFPSGTLFGGTNPHVSLIGSLAYQSSRGKDGGIFNPHSTFWVMVHQWVYGDAAPGDPVLVIGGTLCALLALTQIRRRPIIALVGAASLLLWLFLGRGGITIGFYLLPVLPLLALNLGLVAWLCADFLKQRVRDSRWGRVVEQGVIVLTVGIVVVASLGLAYGPHAPDYHRVVPLWQSDQAQSQSQALAWTTQHVPAGSSIIIDDFMYTDLQTSGKNYTLYWYWKVDLDPAIHDTKLHGDWRNVDYVITTPQVLSDAKTNPLALVLQVIAHSTRVAHFDTDGWDVDVRRVDHSPAAAPIQSSRY